MNKGLMLAVAALCVLGGACSKKNQTADTTTIPGVDTTKGRAMKTTDTVVKTTTTDTLRGQVPRESVKTKAAMKTTKTKTKTGAKTKTKY
jgi:hypothetical protein